MAKKRYTEIQIYRILHENKCGVSIQALVKKYEVSQATIYNWKAKYGRTHKSEIEKLFKLEEENKKLRASFIELWLENSSLKTKLKENLVAIV